MFFGLTRMGWMEWIGSVECVLGGEGGEEGKGDRVLEDRGKSVLTSILISIPLLVSIAVAILVSIRISASNSNSSIQSTPSSPCS